VIEHPLNADFSRRAMTGKNEGVLIKVHESLID